MADNRDYFVHKEGGDSVCISEDVIASVAAQALSEVEGIVSTAPNMAEQLTGRKPRVVQVSQEDDKLLLDLYLTIRSGCTIPDVSNRAQEAVLRTVASMTGFDVGAVNVHVNGITFE